MSESPPQRVLEVTRRISGPPERVFARFTDDVDAWWRRGARFRQWPDSTVSFTHHHLIERRGSEVVRRARVLEWTPPDRLVIELDRARVELSFEADADHTRVTVRHHRPLDGRTAFQDPVGVRWAELLAGLDRLR